MKLFLAIDQSTSATKAVLFEETGRVVDSASREHRQIYPRPGWVEHDPEEIWTNVLAAIREVANRSVQQGAAIVGMSVTNQRETIVVFDRATGRPLHNALVWQDRRGDALCQNLRESGWCEFVQARTGLRIDGYFSASKLAWLIGERPELASDIESGRAVIGTIDAFLIYRLTKGTVFATDATNASRTLLFDIEKLRWDPELCDLFRVPLQALPEVRECCDRFGTTDAGGALPGPLPICGVLGDSQASLFAQRCYHPGEAKATFGTGTSVLMNVGNSFRLPEHGAVAALAWVCLGHPTYALEGLINFSAASLTWLRDQLGLIASTAETEALALSVEDNGGVYFIPAFAGLGPPHWQPEARAAILGMTAFSRREHVVRSALESIAFQIRDVLEMLQRDADVAPRSLRVDGGLTRNAFVMQFTADITGLDLEVSDVPEASSLGAMFAGLLGLGERASLDELAALPRPSQTFSPRMDRDRSERLHRDWLAAVKRVL